MSFFSKLFGSDKTQNETTSTASNNENAAALYEHEEDSGELVAVIMAALMNMLSGETNGGLNIKSIRRIGRNSPVWNVAGRDEYIATKL